MRTLAFENNQTTLQKEKRTNPNLVNKEKTRKACAMRVKTSWEALRDRLHRIVWKIKFIAQSQYSQ
jgi:hypothetical protein